MRLDSESMPWFSIYILQLLCGVVWCDKHKAVNYRSERQFSHELARQMKTARIVNNKMSAVSQAMAVTGLLLLYVVRALVRLRTERIRTQIFNFQFTSQSIIPRLFGDEADSFGFFFALFTSLLSLAHLPETASSSDEQINYRKRLRGLVDRFSLRLLSFTSSESTLSRTHGLSSGHTHTAAGRNTE
jgi:hypothetical protein